jgi:hypothetical protein
VLGRLQTFARLRPRSRPYVIQYARFLRPSRARFSLGRARTHSQP